MRGDGEGWVHQHDARPDGAIETIVDLRRVVARNGEIREQQAEEIGANVGEFVERKRHAVPLGENRQQPRASRRLENDVALNDCTRDRRDEAEAERRRELLIRLALIGAARLRRQQACDARQHSEEARRRRSLAAHRRTVSPEKEDLRDLASLIGVLP